MSSEERNTKKCQILIKQNNIMILDRLNTTDGFDIFWVHDNDSKDTIYEDDLWHCEYNLKDWLEEKLRDEDIDVHDITNHIEDTIDLVDMHKDILLESFEYAIKEDTDDFFKGMDKEEMIELAKECVKEWEDEYDVEEDFVDILEKSDYEVEE